MVVCTDNDRLQCLQLPLRPLPQALFRHRTGWDARPEGPAVAKSLQPSSGELARAPSVGSCAGRALAMSKSLLPKFMCSIRPSRLVSQIHDYVRAHDARLLVALQSSDGRLIARLKTEQIHS